MIIAVDLDSVLNNLLDTWLAAYNAQYDDVVTPEDILTWDTHNHVKCGTDIYKLLTPELFTSCLPMPGAIETTKRLLARHEVIVVSATGPFNYGAKRDWLRLHFPHLPVFIATHHKEYVNCAYLIDDGPRNLEAVGPGKGIAYSYAYNRDWKGMRVFNWFDIEQFFR